jgi:hypothetical protein
MIYVDQITKKPIEYNENNVFMIYTKGGYHKKKLIRIFPCARVEEALKFFYDLEITKNHRKYLVKELKDSLGESKGETILSMKGYFPNTKALKLKIGQNLYAYEKIATLNLVHTPITLARKLNLFDLETLPMMHEKWSKSKIVYALLSYIFSIPENERNELMKKAYRAYILDKLSSGASDPKELKEYSEVVTALNNDDDIL